MFDRKLAKRRRVNLLASSAIAAVLTGAGAPAAWAFIPCRPNAFNGVPVPSITNTQAITCIYILNSTVTGNITNAAGGLIAATTGADGITVEAGSIGGTIVNNGSIIAPSGNGISIQSIATVSGGISNSGTISAGYNGIRVFGISSFSGEISNSGTISAGYTGISTAGVSSFSGGISNSGTISAGYAGILVSAVSSFSGGISNSGTISAGGYGILISTVSSISGGISNSGTISAVHSGIDVVSVSSFSGGISNSGTISAVSGIDVGGVRSFSGGISNSGMISAGSGGIVVLNISSFSGGISNSGTISAAAGGIVVGATTFSGNVSNSGSIIGGRTGIYICDCASFTGGAIINSGTISASVAAIDASHATNPVIIDQTGGLITGAIKLSAYADQLNISGGTIDGNIIGQGATNTINFVPGAGSAFTYGAGYTFTGINQVNVNSGLVILDGTGNSATNVTVAKGAGLEVGDSAHPGATLIAANPVDVEGTLAGHGTIDGSVLVANGGTLSPGGSIGTLTINGNLTMAPGSIYTVATLGPQSSQTQVNGSATLNGVTVAATPSNTGFGFYAALINHPIFSTTNPLGAGNTFSPSVVLSPQLTAAEKAILAPGVGSLSYDANDVYLSLPAYYILLSLPSNAPANALNVAGVFNKSILSGASVPAGFQNLASLSGTGLNTAVNQLAGQGQGAFAPLGFEAGNQFLGLMLNPYVEGRGAGFGPAAQPLAYASEPAAAPAARAFNALALDGSTSGPGAVFAPRLSIWSSAYGGSGSITGNGFTGAAGTDSQIYGVATGLDYLLAPNTVVGLALGGGGAAWQSGVGSGHSSMFQGGIYGTTRLGAAYVSGAFAYSQQDVTTNRVATLAGYDVLQGNFAANVVSARLESGYRLPYGFVAVTPYGAVQTQAMFLPAYSEYATVGSSQFALNYASRTFDATRTEAGAWFDSDYFMSQGVKLYGRLAWAHDFDNEGTTTALFQSLPGQAFVINSVKPAHDGALVTAGFEYRLADGWSVLGKFDGEYSATTAIFAGMGTLRKVW